MLCWYIFLVIYLYIVIIHDYCVRIKLITKIKLFGGEIPIAYVISLIFGMTMNCNRYYHFCTRAI